MAGKAKSIAAELHAKPPRPELASEAEAAAEPLTWLDGHFTFLGYREYDYLHDAEASGLEPIEHTSLGISALRPLAKSPLSNAVAEKALEPHVLVLTKATSRSRVIRGSFMDYIGVKTFDETGEIVGERRFVGVFKPEFYNDSVLNIPVINRKVRKILSASGFPTGSHSANELLGILETYPRDDLMHEDTQGIFDVVMQIVDMQERRQSRVFVRTDPYQRFVSVILYMPRDLYDTAARVRVQEVLRQFYNAESVDFDVLLTESALARIHFVARVARDAELPQIDPETVEKRIVAAVRSWSEDVHAFLAPAERGDSGTALARADLWSRSFPPGYGEYHTPADAVADVARFEAIESGEGPAVRLYRPNDVDDAPIRLALYRDGRVGLSEVPPTSRPSARPCSTSGPTSSTSPTAPIATSTTSVCGSTATSTTLTSTGSPRPSSPGGRAARRPESSTASSLRDSTGDVTIIRALGKYLRQAGFTYSDAYVGEVYSDNPEISRLLVDYFFAKFDPDADDAGRDAEMARLDEAIETALGDVASLDADRVPRSSLELLRATLRTNYFQNASGERRRRSCSRSVRPSSASSRSRSRRWRCGCTPRRSRACTCASAPSPAVACAGRTGETTSAPRSLASSRRRWSRTPSSCPRAPRADSSPHRSPMSDRDAWMAAGQAAYEVFIESLLEVADNLVYASDGTQQVVHPDRVVRHDGDDYYLVVAADKGTARFSDVANAIAERRGFWLGDAFASGGSVGYDHKKMAITSRGAWKSVERHFREIGVNTDVDDFTVVGIGDMSGDVFGNGMLRGRAHPPRRRLRPPRHLHRPEPGCRASFVERRRLFDLPRSSWQDYDRELISAGGGVYPRSAKSIDLSPEAPPPSASSPASGALPSSCPRSSPRRSTCSTTAASARTSSPRTRATPTSATSRTTPSGSTATRSGHGSSARAATSA